MRPFPLQEMKDIHNEMMRTEGREFPKGDWPRMAALLAEETGEVAAAALDFARLSGTEMGLMTERLDHLYEEATHTANMAVRIMERVNETRKLLREREDAKR